MCTRICNFSSIHIVRYFYYFIFDGCVFLNKTPNSTALICASKILKYWKHSVGIKKRNNNFLKTGRHLKIYRIFFLFFFFRYNGFYEEAKISLDCLHQHSLYSLSYAGTLVSTTFSLTLLFLCYFSGWKVHINFTSSRL